MESKKIVLDVLGVVTKYQEKVNSLMHITDTFEKGKQLVDIIEINIVGDPDLNKLCNLVADKIKEAGGYAVFVGIQSVNGVRVKNPQAYIMEGVRMISTQTQEKGLCWALLKDSLIAMGYKPVVNENMVVTAVN